MSDVRTGGDAGACVGPHAGAPALCVEGLTFAYPGSSAPVLSDVSLKVPTGSFALLAGATGSGKSTLLRLCKPELAPAGERSGTVRLFGADASFLGPADSARAVGLVFQNPDAQLVCDSVWHELAFGLENLGVPEPTMRRRVAETCDFLGIEPLFRRQVSELSGGQRQTVALAAALAMRPRLLLLDEPTSMLDPVAEHALLSLLFRANRELGVTVVVATHRPAPMAGYATQAMRLVEGRLCEVSVAGVARPRRLDVGGEARCPTTGDAVDASDESRGLAAAHGKAGTGVEAARGPSGLDGDGPAIVGVHDAWLRYGRGLAWVLRGLDLELRAGEIRALVGANGCGKSTLLHVVAGIVLCQRGRVRNSDSGSQALLPQDPKALLSHETVREELASVVELAARRSGSSAEAVMADALARLGLEACAGRHPYDLSGGQQQLLALEELLLAEPRLLLLDEPTKGLDDAARERVARCVLRARHEGATVLVATHDLGFVRAVADAVSLMFDGGIVSTEPADDYFADSWLAGGEAW